MQFCAFHVCRLDDGTVDFMRPAKTFLLTYLGVHSLKEANAMLCCGLKKKRAFRLSSDSNTADVIFVPLCCAIDLLMLHMGLRDSWIETIGKMNNLKKKKSDGSKKVIFKNSFIQKKNNLKKKYRFS